MKPHRVTSNRPQPFPHRAIVAAYTLPIALLTVSGGWMAFAPLQSAVIAPGVVNVETYRKAIQHLEGGIIDEIKVRDGDHVKRGDVLVVLQNISDASHVDRLKTQYVEALAAMARLTAERDGADSITFAAELVRREKDPVAANAMKGQNRVFKARRTHIEMTSSVTGKKIAQLNEERTGLAGQINAVRDQAGLLDEEYRDAKDLYEKKLLRKSRYLEIRRKRASLDGERANLEAKLSETAQEILELELKLSETRAARLSEVTSELQTQSALAYRFARELAAAEDRLERTRIRAPIDGTIVGVDIHTRQGVIAGGQVLMEIVPARDGLMVEAKVRPEDIETVHAGLEANVVLQTLNKRYGTPIAGRLEQISADRLVDEATGQPFYKGRVILDPGSVEASPTVPRAGMAAEVFIQTGERTPLQYLIAPVLKSFNKALREQ
ncbi:MAG: HlyD family type I secretion periplasmic adaptor subunit [Hyphomicrobiaceae bacterium]|nr:HlyD family type I secretion periplasmic adaptor subunit [Hyphomicrobiaceae bacterium]